MSISTAPSGARSFSAAIGQQPVNVDSNEQLTSNTDPSVQKERNAGKSTIVNQRVQERLRRLPRHALHDPTQDEREERQSIDQYHKNQDIEAHLLGYTPADYKLKRLAANQSMTEEWKRQQDREQTERNFQARWGFFTMPIVKQVGGGFIYGGARVVTQENVGAGIGAFFLGSLTGGSGGAAEVTDFVARRQKEGKPTSGLQIFKKSIGQLPGFEYDEKADILFFDKEKYVIEIIPTIALRALINRWIENGEIKIKGAKSHPPVVRPQAPKSTGGDSGYGSMATLPGSMETLTPQDPGGHRIFIINNHPVNSGGNGQVPTYRMRWDANGRLIPPGRQGSQVSLQSHSSADSGFRGSSGSLDSDAPLKPNKPLQSQPLPPTVPVVPAPPVPSQPQPPAAPVVPPPPVVVQRPPLRPSQAGPSTTVARPQAGTSGAVILPVRTTTQVSQRSLANNESLETLRRNRYEVLQPQYIQAVEGVDLGRRQASYQALKENLEAQILAELNEPPPGYDPELNSLLATYNTLLQREENIQNEENANNPEWDRIRQDLEKESDSAKRLEKSKEHRRALLTNLRETISGSTPDRIQRILVYYAAFQATSWEQVQLQAQIAISRWEEANERFKEELKLRPHDPTRAETPDEWVQRAPFRLEILEADRQIQQALRDRALLAEENDIPLERQEQFLVVYLEYEREQNIPTPSSPISLPSASLPLEQQRRQLREQLQEKFHAIRATLRHISWKTSHKFQERQQFFTEYQVLRTHLLKVETERVRQKGILVEPSPSGNFEGEESKNVADQYKKVASQLEEEGFLFIPIEYQTKAAQWEKIGHEEKKIRPLLTHAKDLLSKSQNIVTIIRAYRQLESAYSQFASLYGQEEQVEWGKRAQQEAEVAGQRAAALESALHKLQSDNTLQGVPYVHPHTGETYQITWVYFPQEEVKTLRLLKPKAGASQGFIMLRWENGESVQNASTVWESQRRYVYGLGLAGGGRGKPNQQYNEVTDDLLDEYRATYSNLDKDSIDEFALKYNLSSMTLGNRLRYPRPTLKGHIPKEVYEEYEKARAQDPNLNPTRFARKTGWSVQSFGRGLKAYLKKKEDKEKSVPLQKVTPDIVDQFRRSNLSSVVFALQMNVSITVLEERANGGVSNEVEATSSTSDDTPVEDMEESHEETNEESLQAGEESGTNRRKIFYNITDKIMREYLSKDPRPLPSVFADEKGISPTRFDVYLEALTMDRTRMDNRYALKGSELERTSRIHFGRKGNRLSNYPLVPRLAGSNQLSLDLHALEFFPMQGSQTVEIYNANGALIGNTIGARGNDGNRIIQRFIEPMSGSATYSNFARFVSFRGEMIVNDLNPYVTITQRQIVDAPERVINFAQKIRDGIIEIGKRFGFQFDQNLEMTPNSRETHEQIQATWDTINKSEAAVNFREAVREYFRRLLDETLDYSARPYPNKHPAVKDTPETAALYYFLQQVAAPGASTYYYIDNAHNNRKGKFKLLLRIFNFNKGNRRYEVFQTSMNPVLDRKLLLGHTLHREVGVSTQFVTQDGWKLIEQARVGDLVVMSGYFHNHFVDSHQSFIEKLETHLLPAAQQGARFIVVNRYSKSLADSLTAMGFKVTFHEKVEGEHRTTYLVATNYEPFTDGLDLRPLRPSVVNEANAQPSDQAAAGSSTQIGNLSLARKIFSRHWPDFPSIEELTDELVEQGAFGQGYPKDRKSLHNWVRSFQRQFESEMSNIEESEGPSTSSQRN